MAALRDLATEAFLVGLAPADGDKQALGRLLEVLDIQRNEFGPSERTGEAKQQNGAVAQATKRLRVCSHRDDDVGGRRRENLCYGRSRPFVNLVGEVPRMDAEPWWMKLLLSTSWLSGHTPS
jgi:hypothetical protein